MRFILIFQSQRQLDMKGVDPTLCPSGIEVWGPYACFSRPERKTERVSYDVITPLGSPWIDRGDLLAPRYEVPCRQDPRAEPHPLHDHPPQRSQIYRAG